MRKPILSVFLAVAASSAATLPSGGTYTAGVGSISHSGNGLTINQSTLRGVIDWSNFSIGQGGIVTFKNGSGATLNRVDGSQMSTILGSLISSGSVYLINPEGVLIGPGAHVHTGGDFLASTLNISNSAFMQGGSLLFQGSSPNVVVNLGDIFSENGSVFLIGHAVTNSGSVSAANGTAGLAAGSEILLKDSTGDQRVFVNASGGDVANTGSIAAAQVELRAKGGNIYALAGNNSGRIAATGTTKINGHAWLISDGGTTTVTGSLIARNANGLGGAIETSGHNLNIGGAAVSTGQGGNWLLDPVDLTIDSGAASTIESSLANSNVTVSTSATGASGPGTQAAGIGDINVASGITWSSPSALTLSAYRDINVNTGVTIANTGAGNLILRADNASTGSGLVNFTGTGKVDYSASTGDVAIFYDPPAGYATPVSYSSRVLTNGGWTGPADQTVTSQSTAYMLVNNVTDLGNVSTNLTATYALGKDVDAASISNFTPIGLDFSGIFDGQGYIISNLTENGNLGYVGLFARNSGIVRNLVLSNESLTASNPSVWLGGVAGYNDGTISNSSSAGTIVLAATSTFENYAFVGGLVGQSDFRIINSQSSASVSVSAPSNTSTVLAGGLVGYSSDSISNSYATGALSLTGSVGSGMSYVAFGGLAGEVTGTASSSFSTGSVPASANGVYSGGLVGYNAGTVTNSYWDTLSSGQANAVAMGACASGCAGETTSILQSNTLPSGFDSSLWGSLSGFYPFLKWQYVPYTGTVETLGRSPLALATVNALINGAPAGTVTSGSNGEFSMLLPAGEVNHGAGVLLYLSSGGVGNDYVEGFGNNASLSAGGPLFTNNLLLVSAQSSTYSALLNGLFAALGSHSGPDFLFSANGGNINLASGIGLILYADVPQFSLDMPVVATAPAVIETLGNLTLANGATITVNGVGSALELASGGAFTNDAGASALTVNGGGRWLIYSRNPANDATGGLSYDFKQYNATFQLTSPAQSTGNGLLYSLAPVITPSLTGAVTKTYNASDAAALTAANFEATGAVAGDIITFADTGAAYNNADAAAGKPVTATGVSMVSAVNGSTIVYGYQLGQNTAAGDIGTITPATLFYSANSASRVFGTANPAFSGSVSGFIGGQTLSSATTGSLLFASPATLFSAAGKYAINGSGLTATNYTFAQAPGNATAFTIAAIPAPPPPPTPVPAPAPLVIPAVLPAALDSVPPSLPPLLWPPAPSGVTEP